MLLSLLFYTKQSLKSLKGNFGELFVAAAYNNQLAAKTGLGLTQGTALRFPACFTRLRCQGQNKATGMSRGEEVLFAIPGSHGFTMLFIPLPPLTIDKYNQNKSSSN